MPDGDLSHENLSLEDNLAGWLGWLADPDSNVRQFAAHQVSAILRDHGLSWADVARVTANEVRRRAARRSGR